MLKKLSIAFIAILVALAFGVGASWFVRAQNTSATNACVNNLRQIEGAVQQWAVDSNAGSNSVPTWDIIRPYIGNREGTIPKCPQGGNYSLGRVIDHPRCSLNEPGHTMP